MAVVQIGVLGPLVATVDGRPAALGSPKARAVLALLALHPGRVVSTGRLVTDIWGPDAGESAVLILRSLVSRLRSALDAAGHGGGAVLRGRRPGYVLDLPATSVDAGRLAATVTAANQALHDGRPGDAVAAVAGGLALVRDTVLADVRDLLEDGASSDVARLDEAVLSASVLRLRALLAVGAVDDVAARAPGLAELAPLNEDLIAIWIHALARTGRSADALRVYHELRRRLDDEIGMPPGAVLQRIYQQVLRGEIATDSATTDPGATDAVPGRPAHGQVLDVVDEALAHAARAGTSSSFLLTGEPGSGRTDLLGLIVQRAQLRGLQVRTWRHGSDADNDPKPTPPGPATLVTIDDLRQADPGAVRDVAGPGPVVLVATTDASGRAADRLAATLGRGTRLLELAPWTEDEVTWLLARSATDGRADGPTAAALHRATGGNQRLVQAALSARQGRGLDPDFAAGLEAREPWVAADGPPRQAAAVVAEWLLALPEGSEETLAVAALVGDRDGTVAVDLLLRVTAQDPQALDLQLAAAIDARLLEASAHPPGSMRFRHGWVRSYLLRGTAPLAAAGVHARIAHELVATGRTEPHRLSGHLAAAYPLMDHGLAAELLLAAETSAHDRGDLTEAVELAVRAREHAAHLPPGAQRNRLQLTALGRFTSRLGPIRGWASADEAQAFAEARRVTRTAGRDQAVYDALARIADSVIWNGAPEDRAEFIADLEHIAEEEQTAAWHTLHDWTSGTQEMLAGRVDEAIRRLSKAVGARVPPGYSTAHPHDAAMPSDYVVISAGLRLANAHMFVEPPDRISSAAVLARVRRQVDLLGDPFLAVMVDLWSAITAFTADDVTQTIAMADLARIGADQHGLRFWLPLAKTLHRWGRARVAVAEGRQGEAIIQVRALMSEQAEFAPVAPRAGRPMFLLMLADVQRAVDPVAAAATVDRALSAARSNGEQMWVGRLLAIGAALGDPAQPS